MISRLRSPIAMLTLATSLWGAGFTWAKQAGALLNAAAGMEEAAMIGPMTALAIRFGVAAVLWLAIFPAARRGWTRGTLWRGAMLGFFLAGGVITQHLALARAPAATVAFLTSLTIVVVPLMIALAFWRLPPVRVMLAVALAAAGIWLLTGARRAAPDIGELYGLACAILFSVELLLLNILVPGDSAMRLTPLMFAITATAASSAALVSPGRADLLRALHTASVFSPQLTIDLALLTALTTLAAFGLMTAYQPMVDPTRAALVYLLEPIFAALYAWIAAGAGMTRGGLVGAALILLANVAAERDAEPLG